MTHGFLDRMRVPPTSSNAKFTYQTRSWTKQRLVVAKVNIRGS
jgi:hypothetical protein